uniref:Uncharacterized protein n=1 Tax=Arundo donax TaxID=35708 RepID=A0A0A8ZKU0_ARUDO
MNLYRSSYNPFYVSHQLLIHVTGQPKVQLPDYFLVFETYDQEHAQVNDVNL